MVLQRKQVGVVAKVVRECLLEDFEGYIAITHDDHNLTDTQAQQDRMLWFAWCVKLSIIKRRKI